MKILCGEFTKLYNCLPDSGNINCYSSSLHIKHSKLAEIHDKSPEDYFGEFSSYRLACETKIEVMTVKCRLHVC